MRDIAFAKSSDGGRRFGPLVKVSEDNWELNGCPEDGPAMAADGAGVIHIAWTTLIKEGEGQKALFCTTSRDGKSFSRRARVPTDGVTNPGHPQIVLASNRGATIVWDDTANRSRRISWNHAFAGGTFGTPQALTSGDSASNPAIARTGDGDLLVAWTSRSANEESVIRVSRFR